MKECAARSTSVGITWTLWYVFVQYNKEYNESFVGRLTCRKKMKPKNRENELTKGGTKSMQNVEAFFIFKAKISEIPNAYTCSCCIRETLIYGSPTKRFRYSTVPM